MFPSFDTLRTALTTPVHPILYTIAGFAIIAFFAWRGSRRGLARELAGIVSIGGSVFLAKPFSWIVPRFLPLDRVPFFLHEIVALTIGGALAYILVYVLFLFIASLCGLFEAGSAAHLRMMRAGGAALGGVFGGIVVLLFGWYVASMGPVAELIVRGQAEKLAGSGASLGTHILLLPAEMAAAHRAAFQESFAGSVAEQTNPIPDEVTEGLEIVTQISEHPEELQRLAKYEPVAKLLQEESVLSLADNAEIRMLAEQGDIVSLLNHPAVRAVLEDPAIQEILEELDPKEILQVLRGENAPMKP